MSPLRNPPPSVTLLLQAGRAAASCGKDETDLSTASAGKKPALCGRRPASWEKMVGRFADPSPRFRCEARVPRRGQRQRRG